jgi:Phage integrase family
VNRPLGVLRTLLRQALRWKFISEVPEIEFEDESAGVVRFLRPDEATRLLAECRKSRNPALADLVEFAMFTGVRRGEALGLTWDRVDRARGVVLLTETTNGRPRARWRAGGRRTLPGSCSAVATGTASGRRGLPPSKQPASRSFDSTTCATPPRPGSSSRAGRSAR